MSNVYCNARTSQGPTNDSSGIQNLCENVLAKRVCGKIRFVSKLIGRDLSGIYTSQLHGSEAEIPGIILALYCLVSLAVTRV